MSIEKLPPPYARLGTGTAINVLAELIFSIFIF